MYNFIKKHLSLVSFFVSHILPPRGSLLKVPVSHTQTALSLPIHTLSKSVSTQISSFPFSLIKNHGFTRQEADSCGEKGSELLCFSFFPLSLSEPKHGIIREGRLTTPKFQCFNNTHRFILHSFSVDMSRGWRWRGLCSIQLSRDPGSPSSGFANSQGPGVLHWIIYTQQMKEESMEQLPGCFTLQVWTWWT